MVDEADTESDGSGVLEGVGVAEHMAYASELHSPGTATPPEQQSQQMLPDAGHSEHEYCAATVASSRAASTRKEAVAAGIVALAGWGVGWRFWRGGRHPSRLSEPARSANSLPPRRPAPAPRGPAQPPRRVDPLQRELAGRHRDTAQIQRAGDPEGT